MIAKELLPAMPSPNLGPPVLLLALLLASGSACAQLYKWVDQNGVTNYSNQPPADPAAIRALRPIEDRISVYAPDPGLTQAIETMRQGGDRTTAGRTSRPDARIEGGQRGSQPNATAVPDACLSGRAVDCSPITYAPYDASYGYAPGPYHRPRRPGQPNLTPGTSAGQVVGDSGYIPGYSTSRPARPAPPPRALYEATPPRVEPRR
jgi:hypothetical protein